MNIFKTIKKFKNNGTEEIKCSVCNKGFPHGAVAIEKQGYFLHKDCISKSGGKFK